MQTFSPLYDNNPPSLRALRYISYRSADGSLQNVAIDADLMDTCRLAGIDPMTMLGSLMERYAQRNQVPRSLSGRFLWKSRLGIGKEKVVELVLREEIDRMSRLKGVSKGVRP